MPQSFATFAAALIAASPAVAALPAPADHRAAPVAQSVLLATDFLKAFNGGRRAEYERFLRRRWPAHADPDGEYAALRDQTGGLDVVKVERVAPDRVVEIVRARLADDYFRLELEVGEGPAYPIRDLRLVEAPRPARIAPPRRVAVSAIGPMIDRRIRVMGDFSGAVLVARNGRVVYSYAAGLADRERRIVNTVQTRFGLASMNKMFVATAVLQLAQAGALDLDAGIGTYLRDYPNPVFARTVTIRHLLTHTGGAGDFMSDTWAATIDRLKTPADSIAPFGNRPPEVEPGSRFAYADYGYIVLRRVVEVVSGQPYDAYLQGHVFGPAGMTRTGLGATPGAPARRYVKTPAGYRPPPGPFAAEPGPSDTSTVGDLLAFAKALTGRRLLDAAHTELLVTGKVKGDQGLYAYGFMDRSADGVRDVGHGGGAPGVNGDLHILDDGRAVVIVLSNVAPTWRAEKLCAFIAARLRLDPSRAGA